MAALGVFAMIATKGHCGVFAFFSAVFSGVLRDDLEDLRALLAVSIPTGKKIEMNGADDGFEVV
jgi:hypothetical protein